MASLVSVYKTVDDHKYFRCFPNKWIEEESLNNVGPRYCKNCKFYGSINDIFIGYCLNCANISLKGKRGNGMLGNEILENSSEFDFNKCPYMTPLEQIELKKMIFENNLENLKIIPPILSRSFASDINILESEEYGIFRYDERRCDNWDKYQECECLDKPDSIS